VNCIFGHHESHASSSDDHHHDTHNVGTNGNPAEPTQGHAHASGDADRHHDQHHDDTCCTLTGKRSVIPSAPAGSEPPLAVAVMGFWRADHPQRANHPEQRTLIPVAHSPPIYLRNAALLI